MAKCPSCERSFNHLKIAPMALRMNDQREYPGVVYCCPNCNAALSAGVDFLKQQAGIVDALMAALSKR